MYQDLNASTPHTCRHLATQQPCGGTRQEKVYLFGIHKTASEFFPTRRQLNLVKKERYRLSIPALRVKAEVLFHDRLEVARHHFHKALIFETEVKKAVARSACGKAFSQTLPEEGRLAASPHAYDNLGLAPDFGKCDIPAGVCGHGSGKPISDLLPNQEANFSFLK